MAVRKGNQEGTDFGRKCCFMCKFYPLTERTVEKVDIPASHDEPPDLGNALYLLTVFDFRVPV